MADQSEVMCIRRNSATSADDMYMVTSGDHPSQNMGTPSTEKIKRTRVGLSAKHKREICVYKELNPKATQEHLVQLCKDKWSLPVGRTTLGEILRQKDKWLSITPGQEAIRRRRGGRHHQLEMELFKWMLAQRKSDPSVNLSDQTLIDHAKIIGTELNIDKSFSYSNGWLFKFKKRHGIRSKGVTERFQILQDCYKSDSSHGVLTGGDSNSSNPTWEFDTGSTWETQSDHSGATGIGFSVPLMYQPDVNGNDNDNDFRNVDYSEVIIKEEYISDNENSDDSKNEMEQDETISPISQNNTFPNLHLECETMVTETRLTKTTKTEDYAGPSVTLPPKSTKRIITAAQAKRSALLCIRYIESHHELGEYLDTLWDIHDEIDQRHEEDMTSQRTIPQYFNKRTPKPHS